MLPWSERGLFLSYSQRKGRLFQMAKEKRFVRIHSEGALNGSEIWVDTLTGVNYLYHYAGQTGGLTVLLDRNGNPIVSPLPLEEKD